MLWHLWQTLKCMEMIALHFLECNPKTQLEQKEGDEFTPLASAELYVPGFPPTFSWRGIQFLLRD